MSDEPDQEIEDAKTALSPIIDRCLRDIMEHASSVTIMVTRHDEATKNTIRMVKGAGDYYARLGVAKVWVISQQGFYLRAGADEYEREPE